MLPYGKSVMITEYIAPDPEIMGYLKTLYVAGPKNFDQVRRAFDKKIRELVGQKINDDIKLFNSIGLSIGHWEANTNREKYYEIWPQLDYLKFYQCICVGRVNEKKFTNQEQRLLYNCFKKLLLYNALVVFERKRLKYELFNQDHKTLTPDYIEFITETDGLVDTHGLTPVALII